MCDVFIPYSVKQDHMEDMPENADKLVHSGAKGFAEPNSAEDVPEVPENADKLVHIESSGSAEPNSAKEVPKNTDKLVHIESSGADKQDSAEDVPIGTPLQSPEYVALLSYIRQQYEEVFHEAIPDGQLIHYFDEISSNKYRQSDLKSNLLRSDKYSRYRLEELYMTILNRPIDADGLKHYMNKLRTNRNNYDAIRLELIQSDEYFRKFKQYNLPYECFRIPQNSLDTLRSQVAKGFECMKTKRIIIAGLLRDRVSIIPHLMKTISIIGSRFADYRVLIVENDSRDGTREALETCVKNDSHIILLGGRMNLPKTVNRTGTQTRIAKMANLRNIYLDYASKHFADFDYLFAMDLDINGYPYIEGIASSIYHMAENPVIDMIAVNGVYFNGNRDVNLSYNRNYVYYRLHFYDTFPYTPIGQPYVWNTDREKITRHDNKYVDIASRKYKLGDPLDKLASAFGGLAIYRMSSIKGKSYKFVPNKVSCEHTQLNVQLANCYLNPSMIYFILSF